MEKETTVIAVVAGAGLLWFAAPMLVGGVLAAYAIKKLSEDNDNDDGQ